jgi:glycosyltransferase involved in cell wall biosynthesis
LIHSHIYPGALAGFFSSKLLRLKHVVTVHGIYHDLWKEVSPGWNSVFNTVSERIILRLPYDKMVCVSGSVTERLQRIGVSHKKMEIIPNGVDFENFNPNVRSDIRNRLKIGEEPLITFFGSLTPIKGLPYLFKSIPLIKKRLQHAKFLIVGEGYQKNSLMELARKLKIEDSVIFHKYIPHSSMAAYLIETDVVVVPSLMEGGSLIPLEAMACKTPVVATRVGGIPEIVRNGETGILTEPRSPESIAKGIITILNDKSLREKITSNGYGYVKKNFTWNKVAERTIRLYNSILGMN